MIRNVGSCLLALAIVACSAPAMHEEQRAEVRSALSGLSPGTLAFSEVWGFHTRVGLDQPDANGWVNINYPKSTAALAGTGLGTGSLVAKLDLTFQLTSLDAQFDDANYGERRRVCGSLDRHEYCWNGDGTCEARLDGALFYSASCAPFALGRTYRILTTAGHSAQDQNVFTFQFDGTVQAGRFKSEPWIGGGALSIRTERADARVQLVGLQDGSASSTPVTPLETAGPAGTLLPASGSLPAASNLVNTGSSVSFVLPAAAARLDVYRDGYLFNSSAVTGGSRSESISSDRLWTLDDTRYSYQFVWADAAGNLSAPAVTSFVVPPRASPPRIADGQFKIALVLAYYEDAPGLVNGVPPTPPQEFYDAFFTRAGSPGLAFREISRNTVSVSGRTFGWMKLREYPQPDARTARIQRPNEPICGTLLSDGNTYNCFSSYGAAQQAAVDFSDANVGAAAALHPSDYDLVYALVYGDTTQDSSISPGHRPVNTGLMLHEVFGHNNTLGHAGGLLHDCATNVFSGGDELANVIPGPTFADTVTGARCADATSGGVTRLWTYADEYDPMGTAAGHYYHTMNLERLGFLHPAEVARDYFGGAYTLSRWQRDQTSTKQLRIQLEDNWFYFVEYRTGEGFDGAAPCVASTCNPYVTKNSNVVPGVQIRLFRSTIDAGDPRPDGAETLLMTELPLQDGGAWCDPDRGVLVERTGSSADSASVRVTRGPCTPASACALVTDGDSTHGSISLFEEGWPRATQTFTPTRDGDLKKLTVFLSASGTYQLGFHELGCSGGLCAPFYTQPVTLNGAPITLTTGVPLVAGHTIAFSFSGPDPLTVIGVLGDSYAGGALLDPDDQTTDSDLPFIAYTVPSGCR